MTPSSLAASLNPGSTIGILGGGQLGRMLAQAAARIGLHAHIYCPNPEAPAFEVASAQTIATFDDREALQKFARSVDVVTFEFENIPLEAADLVSEQVPLYPNRKALEISQDRGVEKAFIKQLGLNVADWWPIDSADDLANALTQCAAPALLKTRRLGYDGKGQLALDQNSDPAQAFEHIDHQPSVLEKKISFEREISVVLVQGSPNQIDCYDLPCNLHKNGILHSSTVPSGVPEKLDQQAKDAAMKIAAALDYRGILAVEFFVKEDENAPQLIVNEFAPRVHNSGHWTLDACSCNQFENHIRAVAGWPLGATTRHSDAQMTNLLGAQVLDWFELAQHPDVVLHLYGKAGIKAGRKLGHMTKISPIGAKIQTN
ncbi:MAG: 5-(carboxyamino)imidazole ribonucleotide synthase [bacterium]|nr:5-(carboxyamino)imidazole ribonucleotide synthase [bacterium]